MTLETKVFSAMADAKENMDESLKLDESFLFRLEANRQYIKATRKYFRPGDLEKIKMEDPSRLEHFVKQ